MTKLNPLPLQVALRQASHRAKGGAAFTLIELLTVIAVIAVLSVIVLGGTKQMRYRAKEAQSASNIRQLVSANLAYAADYGRFAPDSDGDVNGFRVRWFGSRTTANMREPYGGSGGYLSDYLAGGKVRYCPVLQALFDAHPSLVGSGYFEKESGGYGYNSAYIGRTPEQIMNPGGGGRPADGATRPQEEEVGEGSSRWPGNLLPNVQDPSRTVMFTSTIMASAGGLVETAETTAYVDYQYGYSMTPTTHFRFRGRALVAWADGHVTFESGNGENTDWNVYQGDNDAYRVGWFGPADYNGYWNPRHVERVLY